MMARTTEFASGKRALTPFATSSGRWLALCLLFLCCPPALAETREAQGIERVEDPIQGNNRGDGVYGRFNGDMSLRGGLGVSLDFTTDTARPLGVVELVAYQTLSLYSSFQFAAAETDPVRKSLSAGLTVSPLFLLRWPEARQWGHAYPDLIVDSLGLGVGAHFTQPLSGTFAEDIGVEGSAVIGIPVLPRANGPWIRLRGSLLSNGSGADGGPRGTLWIYLAWEGFFRAGLLKVD